MTESKTQSKLVFLDVDDTLITPPYNSVKIISNLLGIKPFPTKKEMFNRTHINFFESFPEVFTSKNQMWFLALLSIPFGMFRSQESYAENDNDTIKKVLEDDRVYLLTKNPPLFTRWRIRRIKELFGVDVTGRYLACGPIFKKSVPKIDIIKSIAQLRSVKLSDCLLIDDNSEEIKTAQEEGVHCNLLDVNWNKDNQSKNLIKRAEIGKKSLSWLGAIRSSTVNHKITIDYSTKVLGFLYKKLKLKTKTLFFPTLENKNTFIFGTPLILSGLFKDKLSSQILNLLENNELKNTKFNFRYPNMFTASIPLSESLLSHQKDFIPLKKLNLLRNRIDDFYFTLEQKRHQNLLNLNSYHKEEMVLKVIKALDKNKKNNSTEKFRKYANEMLSDCFKLGSYLGYKYQGLLCRLVFRSVKIDIPYDIKKLEEDNFVVYIPTHRSFFDSSLLIKVITDYSGSIPKVPAALKMKSNIVGMPGRYAGIFYIRRKDVDSDYFRVLNSVIAEYMKDSTSIAVFAEGQRSRTGLTLSSKNGIIQSIIRNRKVLGKQNICLVPISFTYNVLPESDLMVGEVHKEHVKNGILDPKHELNFINSSAKKKRKGKINSILSLFRMKKVSDAYMSFGKPIVIPYDEKNVKTKELLKSIFLEIQTFNPMIPTSMACLILTSLKSNYIYIKDLRHNINYLNFITRAYTNNKDIAFNSKIDFLDSIKELPFVNSSLSQDLSKESIIYIDNLNIIKAIHYRNNVLHYFALPSIIAKSIFKTRSGSLSDLINSLKEPLIEIENIYMVKSNTKMIEKVLKAFALSGNVDLVGEQYFLKESEDQGGFNILLEIASIVETYMKGNYSYSFMRRSERHTVNNPVKLITETNQTIDAQIKDISLDGGFIVTSQTYEVGSRISIQFENRRHNVEVTMNKNDGFVFLFIKNDLSDEIRVKSTVFQLLSSHWKEQEKAA